MVSRYSTIIIGIIILAAGLVLYYNSNFLMYEIVDYTTKPAIPQDRDKIDYDFIFAWADILFLVFLPYLVILAGIIVIIVGGIKFLQKSIRTKKPQINKQSQEFGQKRPTGLVILIMMGFTVIIVRTIFSLVGIFYLNQTSIDIFVIGESNSFDAITIIIMSIWSIIAYQLIRGTWKVRTTVIILVSLDALLYSIYLIMGNWGAASTILINSVLVYYLFRPNVTQYFNSKTSEKNHIISR